MDMMKTLTRLVSAFGPSGCERDISQVIEELAAPYADEISRDVMGNLICRKKGSWWPPTSTRRGLSTWAPLAA